MNYKIQQLVYKENKILRQAPSPVLSSQNDIAIIIHVFYSDIWQEELHPYLTNIDISYDLYVTVPEGMDENCIIQICKDHPNIHIYQTENRGRDVLPFLQVMKLIGKNNYKYLCKLHTKKTEGSVRGKLWRKLLYFDLIGSQKVIQDSLNLFDNHQDIGIISGKNTILNSIEYDYGNKTKIEYLSKQANIEFEQDYLFPAGTMFWIRLELLEPIVSLFISNKLSFEEEEGQMDNTIAHAIERFLGLVCKVKNKKIVKSPSMYSTVSDETLDEIVNLVLTSHAHPNQYKYIQYLEKLTQSMRIKNRLKRLIPSKIISIIESAEKK